MSPLIIMLLASVGPLMVGFDILEDDDEEDMPEVPTTDETDTSGDPVTTVSLSDFIEDARSGLGDPGPFNTARGTDAVQDFEGVDDRSNVYDASGGDDTITGGMLDDTLIGGEDSDLIEGGSGDDAIFGGFNRATRDDDLDADTIDGGEGDDTLFLGGGDIATGGAGADIFVTVQDAGSNSTITDFDADEDQLVVEAVDPDDLSVLGQTVSDSGLVITLSNGASITLDGITEEIAPETVQFVSVAPLLSNIWTSS